MNSNDTDSTATSYRVNFRAGGVIGYSRVGYSPMADVIFEYWNDGSGFTLWCPDQKDAELCYEAYKHGDGFVDLGEL